MMMTDLILWWRRSNMTTIIGPCRLFHKKTQACQGDGAHGRVFGVLQGIPDPLTIFKQIDYVDVNGDYSSDIFLWVSDQRTRRWWWHLKTHRREKSNKCNQCDLASSQAGNLKSWHFVETYEGKKQMTTFLTTVLKYLHLLGKPLNFYTWLVDVKKMQATYLHRPNLSFINILKCWRSLEIWNHMWNFKFGIIFKIGPDSGNWRMFWLIDEQ